MYPKPCEWQKGDRIEMVQMGDDPRPITPGTKGVINTAPVFFQGYWQATVTWDNGRSLGVIIGIDKIKKLEK